MTTPQPYNFHTQNAIGKRGETFLDHLFERRYEIQPASDAEQKTEIDRWFTNRKNGHRFSVEYKSDDKAGKTGNAFIELESNHERGTDGWARMSQAEYLIYYVINPEAIYILRFAELRKCLPKWEADYPKKHISNQTNRAYTTIGIPVPLREFEKCAVLVI